MNKLFLILLFPLNILAQDFINNEIDCRVYEQDLNKADGDNQR